MESGKLEGSLEENVLTLLCWSTVHCLTVRNKIGTSAMFTLEVFAQIAEKAVIYIDQYNAPPQKHLEELLQGEIHAKPSGLLAKTVERLEEYNRGIEPQFVLDSLDKFLRLSRDRMAVEGAAEALAEDDYITAESLMANMGSFSQEATPGTFLHETAKLRALLNGKIEFEELYSCGIPVLDKIGYGLAPQTFTALLGLMYSGKSWMLNAIGKANWMQRHRVLHITLEMSEKQVLKRYIQAFFGVADKEAKEIKIPSMETDEFGRTTRIDFETLTPTILKDIAPQKLEIFQRRAPLLVAEFPTASLNIGQLGAYLTLLERKERFTPNIVLLDSPDLMALGTANLRLDLGQMYKDLRGLAVKRWFALVCPIQARANAANAKLITHLMPAEDISLSRTADNVYTLNQTAAEKRLNLLRVYVSKFRDGEGGQIAVVSQALGIGQFCMTSALGGRAYAEEVSRAAPSEEDRDQDANGEAAAKERR